MWKREEEGGQGIKVVCGHVWEWLLSVTHGTGKFLYAASLFKKPVKSTMKYGHFPD